MRIIIIFALLTLRIVLVAQETEGKRVFEKDSLVSCRGKVYDMISLVPVPFATVRLAGDRYGTITNENGTFSIASNQIGDADTLKISCLGYEAVGIPVSELLYYGSEPYEVFLNPRVYSINDVVVNARKSSRRSARDIVKEAISKIMTNYPQHTFLLDGYYRDYLVGDQGYINLFESRINIQDEGFGTDDYSSSRMKLVAGGMNPYFEIDSSIILPYRDPEKKRIPGGQMNYKGGNELAILRLVDPIRNPDRNTIDYINVIERDFVRNHVFWYDGIVIQDGRSISKICFRTKKTPSEDQLGETGSYSILKSFRGYSEGGVGEGEIYIDSESYIIVRLDYRVYTSDKFRQNFKIWELNEEYILIDDIPYLNYLSYNNAVEIPDFSDSSYFHIEDVLIEKAYKRISLKFNNYIDTLGLQLNNICRIYMDSKAIDFKRIEVKDSLLLLFPENFHRMLIDYSKHDERKLDVRLKKISDVYGNEFEEYKFLSLYQYRELFVRDVLFQPSSLKESVSLKNNSSIINLDYIETTPEVRSFFNSEGLKKE